MGKDPAFLFYPGDWLSGTMLMSRSHKGAYMDLLMAQFSNGHISLQEIKIVLGPDFETMWESVLKKKFQQDNKGLFFNKRLDEEKARRKQFTDSRRDNLKSTKNERNIHISAHMGAHTTTRMENENTNENINENIIENKKEKEKKKKYGGYKNVLLADSEYKKLKLEYPEAETIINYFSESKEMKGYKYKSDYLALKKWGVNAYFDGLKKKNKNISAMEQNYLDWKIAEEQNGNK